MLVSILNGMDSSFAPLLISGFITTIVGLFPLIFVRQSEDIRLYDGFAITILAWFLSCIFGMLPYLMWGGEFTLANAFFESVSGFTTTGATILNDIEALPKGLVFWRSSTHFIGGVGVVVFTLIVLPSMSTFRFKMTKMEISSLSKENYRYRTKELIRIILSVYICITILAFTSLCLAGMPAFDAVNHAFSIVATGGFSTKNASVMGFDSFPIEMVVSAFTLISGLHFGLLYSFVIDRSTKIFKSPVIRFFLLSVIITTLAISFNLLHSHTVDNWFEALRRSFFQVVTISTTTGFATADTSVWPTFSILILMYLSIQGACSGSTTGGLKVDRIWILLPMPI
jgi:trk system potassium uptake protein TrkH